MYNNRLVDCWVVVIYKIISNDDDDDDDNDDTGSHFEINKKNIRYIIG